MKYLSLGIAAGAFIFGCVVTHWYWSGEIAEYKLDIAESILESQRSALEISKLQAVNRNIVSAELAVNEQEQEVKSAVTTKEYIEHVKNNADNRVLSDDSVRIHNLAAGMPAEEYSPRTPAYGTSRAKTVDELLAVVKDNYNSCMKIRIRYKALIKYEILNGAPLTKDGT